MASGVRLGASLHNGHHHSEHLDELRGRVAVQCRKQSVGHLLERMAQMMEDLETESGFIEVDSMSARHGLGKKTS